MPISNITKVRRVTIPAEAAHYDIGRVNDVYVNVAGRDVGSVDADVERVLEQMEFPSGASTTGRDDTGLLDDAGTIPFIQRSADRHVGHAVGFDRESRFTSV